MKTVGAALLAVCLPLNPAMAASFCERMAADTGMKPVKEAPGTAWQVNKLAGIGTFLFGGSVTFMMTVKTEAGLPEIIAKLNDCKPDGKDVACTLVGPSTLTLQVNEQAFTYAAEAGEAAKVTIIKGKSLRCDTLHIPAASPAG